LSLKTVNLFTHILFQTIREHLKFLTLYVNTLGIFYVVATGYLSTMEVFTSGGWQTVTVPAPVGIATACAVTLDENTVMLTGGAIDPEVTFKLIFNFISTY